MSKGSHSPLALLLATAAIAALMVTVAISGQPGPEAARLDSYPDADGSNFFALALKPQVDVPVAPAHDIVVFVETSAKQTGLFRDKALSALRTMLGNLGPADRVQLMANDLNAVPMTKGFVAPNSPEMAEALGKLERRVPLGATDMEKALRAAAASFAPGSANPRAVVYIGAGTSKANLVPPETFKELVTLLADNRIAVTSYAVGPELDMQMLGALAGRTGGRVLEDSPQIGADLAAAARGVVLWPVKDTVAWPSTFTVYPQAPPLRLDRDSVVIGKYTGSGPFEIKMTVDSSSGPKALSWAVTPSPSKPTNSYLAALVRAAQATGGTTLPLVDSASLAEASSENYIGSRNLSQLARQALSLGNLDNAEKLAQSALQQDPKDPEAQRVLKEVADRKASGQPAGAAVAMGAPAGAGLELIGPSVPTPPGAPAAVGAPAGAPLEALQPDGAFMGAVEHERRVASQIITAEVQNTINQARGKMGTDPEGAIQDLKLQLESVKRAADLDPEVRDQLVDQLQAALRAADQRQIEESERRRERLENLAAAKERQMIYENLMLKQQKLKQLIERFNSLMDEGRYKLAEEAAALEAQQLAPNEPVPTLAALDARFTGAYTDLMATRVARQKAVVDTMYQVEKSHVPFPDDPPIVYPDAEVWQQLSARRKERYSSMDLAQRGPAEKKITEALRSPTQLEFIETPLQDVIDFLKDYHQIEIQIDRKALDDVGIGTDTPITRNLKGISLRSALRLLLRDLDLTYVIQDEVLLITTPEEAETRLTTKVYPVADLVLPIRPPSFMGGFGGLGGMGMGVGGIGGIGGGMGGLFGGGGMGGMGMGGMGMGGMGMGGMGMFNIPPNLLPENLPRNGFRAFAVKDDLTLAPGQSPADTALTKTKPDQPSGNSASVEIRIEPGADPEAAWDRHFAKHQESPAAVRQTARSLMNQGKYGHVIAMICAALRHQQAQPWMYEALGLAMQADGRPTEEIERALMSSVDFAQTPLDLMYIGIYMDKLGLKRRALDLYRQVSRIVPLQPEPYVYGLKAAKAIDDVAGLQWATLGILRQAWPEKQIDIWKSGGHEAAALLERLRKEKRLEEAKRYEAALDEAVRRDCVVKVSWTGEADVDLLVEEPSGTVCSFRNPRTSGGGVMLGDTVSRRGKQDAEGFSEVYVCPEAFSGTYRFLLRRVWGEVTAGKVNVEIVTHLRSKNETVVCKQLALDKDEAAGKFDLADGRRKEPAQPYQVANAVAAQVAVRQQVLGQQLAGAIDPVSMWNLAQSRQSGNPWVNPYLRGAVGYQPVIIVLPEGTNMAATAVISADRRYVRVSCVPLFSAISEVNVFNMITGESTQGRGGTGGRGFSGMFGGGFGGGGGGLGGGMGGGLGGF